MARGRRCHQSPSAGSLNYDNQVLDYPRQALALFAAGEARAIDADTRVSPVRQEQLQHYLDPGKSCFLA